MNLKSHGGHSVNHSQPTLQRSHSIAALNGDCLKSEAGHASNPESVTTADTVVRWITAPKIIDNSPENTQSSATTSQSIPANSSEATATRSKATTHALANAAEGLPDDRQMQPSLDTAFVSVRMFEFDPTSPPPITNDTPHIRFAIDQITRDEHIEESEGPETGAATDPLPATDSLPAERIVSDKRSSRVRSTRKSRGTPIVNIGPPKPRNELYIPVDPPSTDSNLRFKPIILRSPAMILLMISCASMIAALIFCAIYSSYYMGLIPYDSGLTNARYFLFRFLPQILAALIFIYVECITSAVARVLPFTMMASGNEKKRYNGLFLSLYNRGLFWPRFDYYSAGESSLCVCSVLLWLVIFTIPLQSSLFSVINVDGTWRWTIVQGVAWTLVAIYFLTLVSVAGIWLYFFRRRTGLLWDPRSIADIAALLSQSNCLDAYQDTEVLANKIEIREKLSLVSQRLGYWKTNNTAQQFIYCIGEKGAPIHRYSKEDKEVQEKKPARPSEKLTPDVEASPQPLLSHGTNSSLLAKVYSPAIRFRHIPWFLNDSFILLWPISTISILVTLLIVTFLPSTSLQNGFPPLVSISINSTGFSTASFLYSFIPSLLGILIYIAFESVTLALSRLTPWAVLSNPSGSTASESLLLEYTAAAAVPFSGIARAISNGHYLISLLLILTPLTLLLPVLAGGFFFPLQAFPSSDVLIFTNMPALSVILAILILCVISLISISIALLSHNGSGAGIGRRRYYLAHPVLCLGEIISFLYASDLVRDTTLRAVRSRADLTARLESKERIGGKYDGQDVRYTFGIFKGDDDRSHLGVSRLGIGVLNPPNLGAGEEGRSRSKFSI